MSKLAEAARLIGRNLPGYPVEERMVVETQQRRHPTRAEQEKAAREFRAAQPLEVVALRPAVPNERARTLRAAHELIVEYGGLVEPGEHGSLIFWLPARLGEGITDRPIRLRLERACELLDSCRSLVRERLVAGEELPDRAPGLGGGLA